MFGQAVPNGKTTAMIAAPRASSCVDLGAEPSQRPRRRAVIVAALAVGVAASAVSSPSGLRAQTSAGGEICGAPGETCAALIAPECLSRFGAGSIESGADDRTAAIVPECGVQLARYRSCLASISELCSPTATAPGGPAATVARPADMLGVWAEIKDGGDADAFEAFARNFPGTALAAIAESRAEALRAAEAETARQSEAEAIWAEIEDLDDAEAFDRFAASYPSSPRAAEAAARAASLRAGGDRQDQNQAAQEAAAAAEAARRERARRQAEAEAEAERAAAERAALEEAERLADERALVRSVQVELERLGYAPGPIDGLMGTRTRNAIRAFEEDAGRLVAGVPNQALLDALAAGTPKPAEAPQRSTTRQAAVATPSPGRAAATTYAAVFNWTVTEARDEKTNECETILETSADGTRLIGREQFCGSAQLNYDLTIDGDFVRGWIQLFTALDGSTRRMEINGPIERVIARVPRYTVRMSLTPRT